jgi:hypothetical protein
MSEEKEAKLDAGDKEAGGSELAAPAGGAAAEEKETGSLQSSRAALVHLL